jgi:hypothetical protein
MARESGTFPSLASVRPIAQMFGMHNPRTVSQELPGWQSEELLHGATQ